MQINSAQDYLTLKKRQIIAATFTQNPPPVKRRNNTIVTALLANKATGYEKVPYAISLAPGSVPGPAYVTAGIRPTVNNCCIQPPPSTSTVAVNTYMPNLTGTTGNTVGTLVTNAYLTSSTTTSAWPYAVMSSIGDIYVYTDDGNNRLIKVAASDSSVTIFDASFSARAGFAMDSLNNIYYITARSGTTSVMKLSTATGVKTTFITSSAFATTAPSFGASGNIFIDKFDSLFIMNTWGYFIRFTSAGVGTTHTFPNYAMDRLFYCKSTDTAFLASWTAGGGGIGFFTVQNVIGGDQTVTWKSVPHPAYDCWAFSPDGSKMVFYLDYYIKTFDLPTNVYGSEIVIAGTGSSGSANGAASSATFTTTSTSINTQVFFGNDSTLYFLDSTPGTIRTIKGPAVLVTPSATTYYPNAGALI